VNQEACWWATGPWWRSQKAQVVVRLHLQSLLNSIQVEWAVVLPSVIRPYLSIQAGVDWPWTVARVVVPLYSPTICSLELKGLMAGRDRTSSWNQHPLRRPPSPLREAATR
jgi:hypothetical protein